MITKLNNDGSALMFSTFLGGSGPDTGSDVVVDASGAVYVVGTTASDNFPTTSGVHGTAHGGGTDVFVTKFDADGDLAYATFIGGDADETGLAIAVDATGNVALAGLSRGDGFPVTSGAFNQTFGGGEDGFVAKLNPSGSQLIFAGYLGGVLDDHIEDLALDADGNLYVVGRTRSPNFPTTPGAFREIYNDNGDAFLVKIDSTGSNVAYATLLGGESADLAKAVAVDAAGNAVVTGDTSSSNYPVTSNAFSQTRSGFTDVFVTGVNPTGTALNFSTFLGGRGFDLAEALTLDASCHIFITGSTESFNFPVSANAFFSERQGSTDLFLARLSPSADQLSYSTFFGTIREHTIGVGIAVDDTGTMTVAGHSSGDAIPVTDNAFDQTANGGLDIVLAQFDPGGTQLRYCTYLGGERDDLPAALALTPARDAVLVGTTNSSLFPTIGGAADTTLGGTSDAFVSMVCLNQPPAPARIEGPDTVCVDEGVVMFQAAAVDDAKSYTWTVPEDATITGGQGTASITVSFGATGGTLAVFAVSHCGPGEVQTKTITVTNRPPPQPGVLTGGTVICPNDTGITYTIPEVPGATGYLWKVPDGAAIVAGDGENTITVDFGAQAGTVRVAPVNGCGIGQSSALSVSLLDDAIVSVGTATQPVCSGDQTTLTASTAANPSMSPNGPRTGSCWTAPSTAACSSR
ncbi:SBBP repeat-containing protein [Acanthopleuribacter pedis]|uniref:SBBP repeat-containing protein n=1 Tax=Acanthopleuribacter pedis TaxID=442870 RepID=A0A8J7Q9E8_9BACT|nr:SBBP repeat-containing protein [Acanthopleuribacter pedis]